MKDLSVFFENPFSDPKLILSNKQKFSEDAIKRIETQNKAGEFTQALNDLEATHATLFGAITTVSSSQAVSMARTETVDSIIDRLSKRNSKLNLYFTLNAVNKTPVYQEFFPGGVTPFTRGLTKGNVEQHINFLVKVIGVNTEVAGGATVLDEYKQLQADYAKARGQQLTKFAETGDGRSERQVAEDAWDDSMFSILLAAAQKHRAHPEKMNLFFNQSILRSPHRADSDGRGRFTGIFMQGDKPVAGVRVHVVDGNIPDEITDGAGGYTTNSLPVGKYTVNFYLDGNLLQSSTIAVVDAGDTRHDVSL